MQANFPVKIDVWVLCCMLIGPVALSIFALTALLANENASASAMIFTAGLISALIGTFIPHSYELTGNHIRVRLGWRLSFKLPYETITHIQPISGRAAFWYIGLKFALSTKSPIEIQRHKGFNVLISPQEPQKFLEAANAALDAHRRQRPEDAQA